jgi:MOSC domain-containing protein YiiM
MSISKASPPSGEVVGIFLTGTAQTPMQAVDQATLIAGRGLVGDRYFAGQGTFSRPDLPTELTLIEAEAIEALAHATGITLEPAATRRNLVTRSIALNELIGREFQVGTIRCRGVRLCPPCEHLERLTAPGVLTGLAGRGGLRAAILQDGEVRLGDAVIVLATEAQS